MLRWKGLRWAAPGAMGVAALIVGLLLIPDRAPVVTQEFNLSVAPQGTVGLVTVRTTQTSGDRYDVEVSDTDASAPVGLQFLYQPDVTSSCPSSPSVLACTPPSSADGGLLSLTMRPNASVDVGIVAPIFTFSANGESAEGWLPYVDCPVCDNSTVFRFEYQVPDISSYDWTSGIPPGSIAGQPVWQQYASQLQEPVMISGTDAGAQQHDQMLTLISGILIGIAVGLLATFLQVILEPRQ